VVAVLNPRELDLSVVSDHPLIHHVASEAELADAIERCLSLAGQGESVFFHDRQHVRWKQLLGVI
jgi:hypothetical protein